MDEIKDMLDVANAAFDQMLQERHALGAAKYGPLKFLSANTVEEAMFELVDLSNYARYTFIKLWFLNEQLDARFGGEGVNIGPDSFSSTKPTIRGET